MVLPHTVQPILGTASFGDPKTFWGQSNDNIRQGLAVFQRYGGTTLDTAQAYQGGWALDAETNSREGILKAAEESLKSLRVPKVDVFYLHAPVYNVPIEETLAGINDTYEAGMFKRFGL
ncbi:NADP-dependent oxidoreductase domain-containing protein [Aspergillus pseudodeflectus]|uniref:NADP-dependent oxidoreductase domain-containing protein n=1 Tax=Aspergillus pseudodeflectus TaxID=176178 RepID=A0ABR4JYI9_9EURO